MKRWLITALALPVILFVSYKGYRYIKNEMTKDVLDIQYVNKPAPDMRGVTSEGKEWSLNSQKGKNVIIIFWASWCRDCIKEIPEIIKLNDKIKNYNHLNESGAQKFSHFIGNELAKINRDAQK